MQPGNLSRGAGGVGLVRLFFARAPKYFPAASETISGADHAALRPGAESIGGQSSEAPLEDGSHPRRKFKFPAARDIRFSGAELLEPFRIPRPRRLRGKAGGLLARRRIVWAVDAASAELALGAYGGILKAAFFVSFGGDFYRIVSSTQMSFWCDR